MDIKLIGIDIDGTLLNSEGILTEATVAALQRAADRGLQVAICTGRFCSEFTDLLVRLPMALRRHLHRGGGPGPADRPVPGPAVPIQPAAPAPL